MTLDDGNCGRKAQFELSRNGDVNTMFSAFSAFYLRGDEVSSPEISGTTQLPVFTCYQKADKRPERKDGEQLVQRYLEHQKEIRKSWRIQ